MGNRVTTMGKKPKWVGRIGMLAALCCLAQQAWAMEYRLQMTNLDYRVFAAYMGRATPWWGQNEPMERLEMRLDALEFPPTAVLPGREVQLLQDPAYGGTIPPQVAVVPATRQQAWTTVVWDGQPGDTVVFVVKSDMAAWQEVWAVAADAGHGLRRLSVGGPALFGHAWQQVPEVSYTFLANAVDQGNFARWVADHAQPVEGLSVVVGRGYSPFYTPDRVYARIQLPPNSRTFKLVIGWRDRNDRNTDKGKGSRMR